MRVRRPPANGALTGEHRGHPLGRQLVRMRQQMRVGREDRVRVVSEASGDDADGDTFCERESGRSVTEGVERPGGDARCLAAQSEPAGEPMRVDRPAELVCKHEVAVDVSGPGEVTFKQLRLTVLGEDANRLRVLRSLPLVALRRPRGQGARSVPGSVRQGPTVGLQAIAPNSYWKVAQLVGTSL
jgi:hypothetical protein